MARAGEAEMDRRRRLRREYLICQERGHDGGVTLTSNPPQTVCARCGTHYRSEVRVIESNVPDRALCERDHFTGVKCPNEPECTWGG